ncbi:unnamed protein product [Porites evermanni]|uniref:Complex 1 LYR protein domain-containing protein n=1 Tax=Porites evermanni TaxID=104178 RepID=A0ABN8MIC6_9CNID|nr:unnamed protein product [Porites evermanni]
MHMAVFKMASRSEVLQLYRQMLRIGRSFTGYNYSGFLTKRVVFLYNHCNFHGVVGLEIVHHPYYIRQDSLEMMKRQVSLGQMYRHTKLVIEKK